MKRGQTHGQRRQYWRETVTAWRESGQTKKAFCREHGIAYYSMLEWSKRLEPEHSGRPKSSLVEVTPGRRKEAELADSDGSMIEVVLRDARIRMPAEATEAQLTRVFSALGLRRC